MKKALPRVLLVFSACILLCAVWVQSLPAFQNSGFTLEYDADAQQYLEAAADGHFNDKVDINTADVEQLQIIEGIGQVLAEQIVEYRTQNGRFQNLHELLEVSGIGEKTLTKIKPYLTVE